MKNFKQFTRDNEPLILEGPMWDAIKAGASSALANARARTSSALTSAKAGIKSAGIQVKNYATSGTAWNHAKAVGRGIGDATTGTANVAGNVLNKTTQVAGNAIHNIGSGVIRGVIGGVKGGISSHGGGGGYHDGKDYDKGKRSGTEQGESAGLEKGRREAKEAGEAASAANRGHKDTIRKFALSKGFDYDKEGGAHRFGVYTNTLRTRPDKVGHDSNGRPYNKKADGSKGGWFSGSTGNTSVHTDADWSEHEKARDALDAAGRAAGLKK